MPSGHCFCLFDKPDTCNLIVQYFKRLPYIDVEWIKQQLIRTNQISLYNTVKDLNEFNIYQ